MKKTINDIYKYTRSVGMMMLSNYPADFWSDYIANHARYDSIFRRMFKSYVYFMQEKDDSIEDITADFKEDVYNHLLINHKKYSELYRINQISDEEYSLLNNYNITEKMDRDTTKNNDNTYGDREDSTISNIGSQTSNSTDKVSPFDSENFYNDNSNQTTMGARLDDGTFSKGEQIDALKEVGTEDYTLTRVGNIGVMTGTDMLDKHYRYWNMYEFYTMIFKDICKELLLVGESLVD